MDRKASVFSILVVFGVVAGFAGCDLGVPDRSSGESPQPPASAPAPDGEDALFGGVNCDKVTTYVCPDGTCLCRQQNCSLVWHDGDYAPCSGPPVAGCEHDFGTQVCFPVGQPIQCNSANVPVGRCSIGCRSGSVTCTTEPNGCCRCERPCYPRVQPPPT